MLTSVQVVAGGGFVLLLVAFIAERAEPLVDALLDWAEVRATRRWWARREQD